MISYKEQKRFFVLISVNGKTVCENRYGYKTVEEAKAKAKVWQEDGFEVGILES